MNTLAYVAISGGGLIHFMIVMIVLGLLWWVFTLIPFPEPARKIVNVVFIIFVVLIVIAMLLSLAGEPIVTF